MGVRGVRLALGLANYLFSTALTQSQPLRAPHAVSAWRIRLNSVCPNSGA